MLVSVGDKLGHYEIVAPLGAGGMGEVYKARDTQLEREVAIKVLPRSLANDPERLARFDREAKVLAALNHPNIAVIYGLVEADGGRALAMELVPGETLGDRLKRGPVPLDETLQVARQIAEALEAAHERGVVHRDLKPANVMITRTGLVKVLDFGLAAMTQSGPSAAADPNNSPTLTMGMTQTGVIMGTAGYMTPEQAAGTPVNRRADIWSYGVVLWEMLSGQRLFSGDTVAHTLAAVLQTPVAFDKLVAPAAIKNLLRRCLDRDVKNRLQWIGEARVAIQRWLANPVSAKEEALAAQAASSQARRGLASWLWPGVAAGLALALASLAFLHFREHPPPGPDLVRFQIAPPDKVSFVSTLIAVSPDGRKLVFAAADADGRNQLWARSLDSLEARALAGTENGTDPFWAPDSRFLAFQSGGKLRKIDVTGGPPQTLCDLAGSGYIAGDWNREGVILFAGPTAGVMRVSAAGGVPVAVTTLDRAASEIYHRKPTFLPDGRHFLYMRASTAEETVVYVGSLDTNPEPKSKRLVATRAFFAFAPPTEPQAHTGYLLLLRDSTLVAQPFDTERLELAGDPVPVAEKVASYGNVGAMFSVSSQGTLVYRTGGNAGASRLTWYNRQGKVLGPAGTAGDPALSPDGARAALRMRQGANEDIWILEFARSALTRLTFDPAREGSPVWSPDGTRVVFSSLRSGGFFDLYWHLASGGGEDRILLKSPENKAAQDWSRDGRFLLYT